MTISVIKAIMAEQYFPVVLFIMLYKVDLRSEFVHVHEIHKALSCGFVYYPLQAVCA